MTAEAPASPPKNHDALLLAIDELIQRNGKPPEDANEKKVKWLYDILTILDNKTAHLFRLNALLLTATAFLMRIVFDGLTPSKSGPERMLLLLTMAIPLLGIFFALPIFRVRWPFLPWKLERRAPGVSSNLPGELINLATACQERTAKHDRVWKTSGASVIAFCVVLLAAVVVSI